MSNIHIPKSLFPTIDDLLTVSPEVTAYTRSIGSFAEKDYELTHRFLKSYIGSTQTYNTYRRDVERFVQWSWLIRKLSVQYINRDDLFSYIDFIQKPPAKWISSKNERRFINGAPNPDWRPFTQDNKDTMKQSALSESSMKIMMASISTYYTFLVQEQYCLTNPVHAIRQKSRLFRKYQNERIIRKLSPQQWMYVIQFTLSKTKTEPIYERHLFVLSCFFLLGLRISELSVNERISPTMGDFFQDKRKRWWYRTVGKGNKHREVAAPVAMIDALKRYRETLGLTPLPAVGEATPLVPKLRGIGGLGDRQIRNLVQDAFDGAVLRLRRDKLSDEANDLEHATVHWLRHTAISYDVEHRPREHVRDDAGHENIVVTDRYIEIDMEARYQSAQEKVLIPDVSNETDG